MAARLRTETGAEVEMHRGGFGELSVALDGRTIVETNPLWYPSPGSVVAKVKAEI